MYHKGYMKNISREELVRYNQCFENKKLLDKYLQLNMAHLQDDMRKYKKYVSAINRMENMLRKCSIIHLKVLNREVLDEEELTYFEEINTYNTAKNKELQRIGILAIVFSVIAVFTTFFLH